MSGQIAIGCVDFFCSSVTFDTQHFVVIHVHFVDERSVAHEEDNVDMLVQLFRAVKEERDAVKWMYGRRGWSVVINVSSCSLRCEAVVCRGSPVCWRGDVQSWRFRRTVTVVKRTYLSDVSKAVVLLSCARSPLASPKAKRAPTSYHHSPT